MIVVKLPAKRSASNPLRVKAVNNKSPTIVTPILMVEHQSRHFPMGTAAVTNVQPDWAGEQTFSIPPDKMAPQSPSLTGSYEGITLAKPPLVKEITVRIPKSKSLIHQGASAKTKDLTNPVQETPTNRNEGAQTGWVMRKVCMYEVPDQEDDTSFMMNMKTKFAPTIETMVTLPMVVEPSWVDVKAEKVPHEWLKPFGAEWTLRNIVQAKTELEAKAILKNWIHKACMEEVVDKMIKGMQKADRINALWWLEELQQPRQYIAALSRKGKDLLIDVQVETLKNQTTFTTKALVDSSCTSSAINQSFVEKHNIPTHVMATPIPIYNADRTKNSGGAITKYAKICLTIRDHAEWIDLAIMELGNRQIFLSHNWLNWHNLIINWKTGGLTFVHCQCRKTPFILPDADPDDKWDEELEEGETILAIDFMQAILICAHHTNDLATKANTDKKSKMFEEMVPDWCRDFNDLFDKDNFNELPEPKTWDHAIELTPNASANLDCKVYPLNRNKQVELDKFLNENLSSGQIWPSKLPMASPFFFIKKKDGKLRPVQDYQKLNEMTIKNRYPLPLISELMDKLWGTKYFSKLDVRWGYNNVCIKTSDEWKAAFKTNRGLFKPTVMFFRLTNSPATFQWMMNDIFKDLIVSGAVTVYLDDILIMSKTKEEHCRITCEVLKVLQKSKLFLKAEKCEFETLKTEYLRVIISEGSIHMDPVKIAGIAEWPVPAKKQQLQSFLGFTNFYWRFIKGYSKVVKPMMQLTGNNPWKWGPAQQGTFKELKRLLAEEVVLAIPTEEGKFHVKADASEAAIGAVLSQEQDGKWCPVTFLSKSLMGTEQNYEIYHKELLAIMLALDEWRHYLMGAAQDFEIWTDHQNLQYFRKPQKLNQRQARWVTELAEYHFSLHHKPGTVNKKANLLSQRADHEQGKEDNNEVTVLKPEHFWAMVMPATEEVHIKIKQAMLDHHWWDKNVSMSLNHDRGMKIDDGLIYYDNRIYIPQRHALWGEIIARSHDHITARHPGIEKTKELVLQEYWWPKMKKDIEAYIHTCEVCQRTKSSTQAKAAPLHPNAIPSRPWTHISIDMVTGLPMCKGYDAILMIVNRFSKEIIPIACSRELSSEWWAKILCDKVYAKHGMPQVVISDRGTVFVSKFMKDLYDLLQIKANTSTAWHPQTDGQTERVNQEVEKYLRIFVNHLQDDWVEWLSLAAFAHNNRTHSATGKSPFEVNYGYNTNIPPGAKLQAPFWTPASTMFISQMQKIHAEAKWALEKATDQMKAQYDKKKHPAIEYQVNGSPSRPSQRKELWHTHSNSLPIGTFIQRSMKHSSPHTCHLHSLIKNNRRHHCQISLMVLNTTKSKKSSTVENARSGERPENHGTGSQTTSSSGRATDQSQTAGYEKTTWTLKNSSTNISPNM